MRGRLRLRVRMRNCAARDEEGGDSREQQLGHFGTPCCAIFPCGTLHIHDKRKPRTLADRGTRRNTSMDATPLLRSIPMFDRLSEGDLESLANALDMRTFPAGTEIFA